MTVAWNSERVIGSGSASAPSGAASITTSQRGSMAEMDPTALQGHFAALAKARPGEHPFTLALRLQAATGRWIAGAQAAKSLEAGGRG